MEDDCRTVVCLSQHVVEGGSGGGDGQEEEEEAGQSLGFGVGGWGGPFPWRPKEEVGLCRYEGPGPQCLLFCPSSHQTSLTKQIQRPKSQECLGWHGALTSKHRVSEQAALLVALTTPDQLLPCGLLLDPWGPHFHPLLLSLCSCQGCHRLGCFVAPLLSLQHVQQLWKLRKLPPSRTPGL